MQELIRIGMHYSSQGFDDSFKERGARYALMMLSEEERKKGVISASAGNHALALCHHGNQLGIPVTVVSE